MWPWPVRIDSRSQPIRLSCQHPALSSGRCWNRPNTYMAMPLLFPSFIIKYLANLVSFQETRGSIVNSVCHIVCGDCGNAFTWKQPLDKHMVQHIRQKPYKCSFCTMNFSQMGNLWTHKHRVHNLDDEKRFQCHQCVCAFKWLDSLCAHISCGCWGWGKWFHITCLK